MADKDRNSYGSILKAIGLFGGVKVFQILVGIIKNKIVAVLIGPHGMGIVGLITSNTQLVKSLTDFGLHTSSIREISKSYSSGDNTQASRTISVFRKLVILTGLLGAVIVFVFAKYLSLISFNNEDYTLAFRIVSVTLFLDQLCVGQTALMQGTFHYKLMARSSLLGSVIGLLVSVPLYYIWGINAIVPVIVITSLTALALSWYYSKKVNIPETKVSLKESLTEGRGMLVLGLAIAAASITRVGKAYGLRIFISHLGSVADVGLYTAGMALSMQYVDVILASMGSDYSQFVDAINRQIRLMCAIIMPLLILFIILAKELVVILYSNEFVGIVSMVEWMMFSMFLRAVSWCLSFPLVALGNPKLYFWNEFSSEVYSLFFNIIGYYYFGFLGLGIAFFITQLCFTIQMLIISRKYYHYELSSQNKTNIALSLLLLIIAFLAMCLLKGEIMSYVLGSIVLVVSIISSYRQLSDMINLKHAIKKIVRKK